MKKSVPEIISEIRMIGYDCRDIHLDGWTTFGYKKDLYIIQEAVEAAIKQAPSFVGEEEWLQEREKKRIIKILKS
jgi:hypothetical protein